MVEIEAADRDPSIKTLRAVLDAAGFHLELRLVPHDDHDQDLAAALTGLSENQATQLHEHLDRFIRGLAAGLATGRPLIGDRERRAN